ncbi:molecular chaperone HscC [Marilutibacter aestuarii]|uniref:Molecular chaperone HscC n=1 Tax=Marilutibacter aestuarii TaxID=1706195 RepID=A0A508AHJ8_9GAMM|nr:molecular chaperone HscC [Lysobacter aestuarii]TQD49640.1 molecular chaperone HscC [Lysobacter aestuarii]
MIVGIDLGTTHSLVGIYGDTGSQLFPNALGDVLTPSVVSVDESGVLVGQPARERLISHPQRTVANFKRWMGSSRETRLGDRSFRPEELSAMVLRSLVADAEAALGEPVREAVISVPAYFSDAQRKATRTAGELAGLKVERLVNEPTAAALAYGLQDREGEGRFLVFDLGGGTFDVSILELFDGVVEVHASTGDNYLGGEDFLDVMVEAFARDHALTLRDLAAHELAQLRRRLEQAKRSLGQDGSAAIEVSLQGRALEWRIDEARFSSLGEPLVQRMRAPVERALRDARLQPGQLDEIVLVGGASRMPQVARLVSRMFGRLPLRHVNPDQAVALGATVAAGLKARDERLEEIILTDVCPYTLGTQVSRREDNGQVRNGYFHPIIPRNSTVPVSREDDFYPMTAEQKQVRIDVYQGESPMVANNIKLGELNVPIAGHAAPEQRGVTVRFTYDVNGLLQVEVREHATGKVHELVLEQNPGLLGADEIRERLAALQALKVHPREQQENLQALARAERLYEEYLAQRTLLQEWIARFRSVLESQDTDLVDTHRRQLHQAMDELEAQA